MRPPVRIGTRASLLARSQTETVAELLRSAGHTVDVVGISTAGDRSAAPIASIGVGVFTTALREALLAGRIDVAVHSYKDLPTAEAPGLTIAAVPERADARDVLVTRDGRGLDELPEGSRIGTGAPRRVVALRAAYPRLTSVPIRGNVDTRVRAVGDGRVDAVVIAAAGLQRLGLLTATGTGPLGDTGTAGRPIDTDVLLPAPAQGALAVECRAGAATEAALRAFDHRSSRATVTAERSLLAALQAGCTAPVAAMAQIDAGVLTLIGALGTADGLSVVRRTGSGPIEDAAGVGQRVAADLARLSVPDPLGSSS